MVNVNSQNSQNPISVSFQNPSSNVISVDNSKAKYYSDIATQAASETVTNKNNSKIWAEGSDIEVQALGGIHSSKSWANISSQGQIQADWNQLDNSQKHFIKNKPNLALKQDKLTAGMGIEITADNIINNTQTSAEWGDITGTISDQTDLSMVLDAKQATLVSGTNIKTINDNSLLGSGNIDILPSQTGESGKFLGTNGTTASWENVETLPLQTGKSNSVLYTDGTTASWSSLSQLDGSFSMPSSRYTDLTLGADGSTYTAPANGWFTFSKLTTGNQYVALTNNSNGIVSRTAYSSGGFDPAVTIPVLKNDVVTARYNTGGVTQIFRFIYAEGDKNA